MSMTIKNQLSNTIDLLKLDMSTYLRTKKTQIIVSTSVILFIGIILGLISTFGYIFLVEIEGSLNRDIINFWILGFYYWILSIAIVFGIAGLLNPFLTSREDADIILRFPVDKNILFYRIIGITGIKIAIGSLVITFLILSPVVLISSISNLNIIWIFFAVYFALLQFILIGYYFYFGLKWLRERTNLSEIIQNTQSPFLILLYLGIPAIFYLFVESYGIISFNIMSKYYFIPGINSSIALTGFLLRSGVPFTSLIGLSTSILYSILLLVLLRNIQSRYFVRFDVSRIIPIYELIEHQKQVFSGQISEELKITKMELKKSTNFSDKVVITLIKKDLLGILRYRHLRKLLKINIVIVPIFSIIFLLVNQMEVLFYLTYTLLYFITEFNIQLLLIDIHDPLKKYPVKGTEKNFAKLIVLSGINFILFLPFFVIAPLLILPVYCLFVILLFLIKDKNYISTPFFKLFLVNLVLIGTSIIFTST